MSANSRYIIIMIFTISGVRNLTDDRLHCALIAILDLSTLMRPIASSNAARDAVFSAPRVVLCGIYFYLTATLTLESPIFTMAMLPASSPVARVAAPSVAVAVTSCIPAVL